MATLLQTLKVSTAQRPRQLSPTMTRRTKLLKLVAEQCDAAAAAINNERHAVHVTRDLPPVDVPIRSGSPGSRLLDGYVG